MSGKLKLSIYVGRIALKSVTFSLTGPVVGPNSLLFSDIPFTNAMYLIVDRVNNSAAGPVDGFHLVIFTKQTRG